MSRGPIARALIDHWDEAVDLDAIFKKANSVCEAAPPS
jgi:hypothetical protein